jgi:hypothetical protein
MLTAKILLLIQHKQIVDAAFEFKARFFDIFQGTQPLGNLNVCKKGEMSLIPILHT